MHHIWFDKAQKSVQIAQGKTLLEAAQKGRVPLKHRCGGNASCTTCKVIVKDQDCLMGMNEKERRKLGPSWIRQGYRLACQARVMGRVDVAEPEDPLKAAVRRQLEDQNKGWNE